MSSSVTADEPLLEMRGIEKSFPGVRALRGVDLQLQRGEVLALLGENGAGKSTLIKILGGAILPDEGTIHIDGRDVTLDSPKAAISNALRSDSVRVFQKAVNASHWTFSFVAAPA